MQKLGVGVSSDSTGSGSWNPSFSEALSSDLSGGEGLEEHEGSEGFSLDNI